jgi:hypothetical protein
VTKSSKEAMKKIAVLSGYSESTVSDVCESLVIYAMLQQLDGLPFVVPNVGEVVLSYRGDDFSSRGKRAVVSVEVTPDDYLVRCVGQLHDGSITDAERRLREMNVRDLGKVLDLPDPANLLGEETA